MILTVSQ